MYLIKCSECAAARSLLKEVGKMRHLLNRVLHSHRIRHGDAVETEILIL